VRDLAREQSRRGHAVGLLCDATSADPLTESRLADIAPELELGLARVAMPRDLGLADLSALTTTRDVALAVRADVLHGHGAKGGAYARLAAAAIRRRGLLVSAFYTPHGGSLHFEPTSAKGRVYMTAERWLLRATDGLIFESTYAARTFATKVGPANAAQRVIPNGISLPELDPVIAAPDAADIVFVGELRRLKGVDVLLEALALVRRERPCRAVVVGAGPEAPVFIAQAAALGLGEAVTFPGAMPARDAFRLGRTLVMPSRAESLPYIALEAAAAGLPLIATDVGGVPEIVAGTDTSLVPPGDAGALASAILEALRDPAAARARAGRLRAAITGRFTVPAMAEAVLAFYESAVRDRGPIPIQDPQLAA
jgi:glycosyltransferase involved in cell wall biosynthesis